jgi:hypothetical protein
MEQIKRIGFAEADRQRVENEVIAAVEADPEPFIKRYIDDPRSFEGRYICADLFKEQFEQYRASKESRNRYNSVIHNATAVLASELYRRVIMNRTEIERDKAIFITGIPGAGKSSSVLLGDKPFPRDFHIIYEGQLAVPASGITKIEQALNVGLKPHIVAVHALPENALANTLKRFSEYGRGASIHAMANIQGFLPSGIEQIYRRFGNSVILTIYDRRDRSKPVELAGWQNLETLKSEGDYEQIRDRLAKELERLRPSISQAAYRQARGDSPIERTMDVEGMVRDSERTLRENVSGRELPQGSSEATVLTADFLRHSLAESAFAIKRGDFSSLANAENLIEQALELSKKDSQTRRIVEQAIENYAKELRLSKLAAPSNNQDIPLKISDLLRKIDHQFAQGLSR